MLLGQSQRRRLNPMIELLEQKKPIFGVSAPSNPRAFPGGGGAPRGEAAPETRAAAPAGPDACGIVPAPPSAGGGAGRGPGGGGAARGGRGGGRGPGGGATAEPPVMRTPSELAKLALDYKRTDYLYNGSMEGGVDNQIAAFTDFMKAMMENGALVKTPYPHFTHPVVLKTPKISENPAKAVENISKQLNTGVSTLMFVEVDCAKEAQIGLNAMRFKSKGGTRPDQAGMAPAYWGMTETQYKQKADVWPLNPEGELVNWSIVETREGLERVREIAAVKGIGVLWPGAGTLRSVLANDPDPQAHEKAIQKVLAACKEFNIACGYPANADDIEMRMKQGFSVFVIQNFGEAGFKDVEVGKKAAGRW